MFDAPGLLAAIKNAASPAACLINEPFCIDENEQEGKTTVEETDPTTNERLSAAASAVQRSFPESLPRRRLAARAAVRTILSSFASEERKEEGGKRNEGKEEGVGWAVCSVRQTAARGVVLGHNIPETVALPVS